MKLYKKLMSCTLTVGMVMSMTACGIGQNDIQEKGVVNTDTSQTEFSIMGGMSALSKG